MAWRHLLVALLVGLVLAVPARADLEAGFNAYQRGDFATALKELQPFAERGHTDAQYYIGFMYHAGKGVTQDLSEAARWYRMAAELGFARAQFNLAVIIFDGYDVARDLPEAAKWFRAAAEQGLVKAQSRLAEMYRCGHGVEESLPIRLTPMTATCRVPPLSRVKLGIGWSRGVARDSEQ